MILNGFKDKFINLILLVICAAIIYSYGTVYFTKRGLVISLLVITLGFFLMWILKPLYVVSRESVIYFSTYFLFAIIIMTKSHFSSNSVFSLGLAFPICIGLTYYLLKQDLFKRFIINFNNLIVIIAIVSMVFWLFGSILQIIHPTSFVYSNWTGGYVKSFYGVYFQTQGSNTEIFGFSMGARNSAIFWEAPLANFIFSFSLISNELIGKKKFFRIILIIAIFTTLTTTSILVLLIFAFYFVANNKKINKSILSIIFLILGVIILVIIHQVLEDKAQVGGSYQVRSYRMVNELKAFISSPIFGNGFDSFTNGSSNSICALAADGGILLWTIYYLPLFNLLRYISKKGKVLVLIFLVMFAITVVHYTYLLYILVSAAYFIPTEKIKIFE